MNSIVFLEEAVRDLEDRHAAYARVSVALGIRFERELSLCLGRILDRPASFGPAFGSPRLRRARLHHFPVSVVFVTEAQRVVVIGVPHDRMSPDRITDRLPEAREPGEDG